MAVWNTTGKSHATNAWQRPSKTTSAAPHFYGMTVNSVPFVNAGSNYTQEIAFTLAKLTDCIDKLEAEGVTHKRGV